MNEHVTNHDELSGQLRRAAEQVRLTPAGYPSSGLVQGTIAAIEGLADKKGRAAAAANGGPTRSGVASGVRRGGVIGRIARMAIAAMVALAAVAAIVIYSAGMDNRALAAAIERVKTARSVAFRMNMDMKVGGGEQAINAQVTIVNGLGMRQVMEGGVVTLIRFDQSRGLVLNPAQKQARWLEFSSLPEEVRRQNVIEHMRNVDPQKSQRTGRELLSGGWAEVYTCLEVDPSFPDTGVRLWVDEETKLPVRMSMSMTMPAVGRETTIVMDDFRWDPVYEAVDYVLAIPDGYTSGTLRMDLDPVTGLIDALRVWAESHDGYFPASLDAELIDGFVRQLRESAREAAAGGGGAVPDSEAEQRVVTFAMGISMAISIRSSDRDFHYAGEGARLGEAGRPIVWFKTQDGQGYEVIDAELTVRRVGLEEAPSAVGVN